MTDIEGFLTLYGHSDNLLNNKSVYNLYIKLCIFTLDNDDMQSWKRRVSMANFYLKMF